MTKRGITLYPKTHIRTLDLVKSITPLEINFEEHPPNDTPEKVKSFTETKAEVNQCSVFEQVNPEDNSDPTPGQPSESPSTKDILTSISYSNYQPNISPVTHSVLRTTDSTYDIKEKTSPVNCPDVNLEHLTPEQRKLAKQMLMEEAQSFTVR